MKPLKIAALTTCSFMAGVVFALYVATIAPRAIDKYTQLFVENMLNVKTK